MEFEIEKNKYILIKNYREGFDKEEFFNRLTDYFYDYDYIVGDWAYGKLRLKGFYKKNNKNVTDLNDYDNLDQYIKNNCAYDCKYFVLEKSKKD